MKTPEQKPEENEQEQQQTDVKSVPKTKETSSTKDERIAELEARLAAAEQRAAGYRAGNDAEIVQQAIRDALAEGKDPWDVMVSVRVPERRDTTEKSYWFMINGKSVQLPADNKYQEMRLPFAETLMNTLKADKYAQNFADKGIQVYDPFTNPHPEK
jgi:hypothetical protein